MGAGPRPFLLASRPRLGPEIFDCAGSAVTVLTAGACQASRETRLDLSGRNAAIWRAIVPKVVRHNPEGSLLIAILPTS